MEERYASEIKAFDSKDLSVPHEDIVLRGNEPDGIVGTAQPVSQRGSFKTDKDIALINPYPDLLSHEGSFKSRSGNIEMSFANEQTMEVRQGGFRVRDGEIEISFRDISDMDHNGLVDTAEDIALSDAPPFEIPGAEAEIRSDYSGELNYDGVIEQAADVVISTIVSGELGMGPNAYPEVETIAAVIRHVGIATSLILGTSTFGNSYRLEKVLFSDPHANVTIGGSCFSNSGLREFTDPPKSVSMSESSCFSSCFGLEKADLSKSYFGGTNAANSLFGSCYALSDVKLPQYMNIMGSYMFQNCYALNGIVDIPADVETISSYVFTECKNLRGVNFLGSSVKTIQSNAFYNCSNLKELKIPPHVATMANCCNYCYTLEKIWMYPLTPPTGTTTLGNISTVYTIYVPKGTLAKYEAQFTAHKGHFQEFIYLISERQSIKKSIKPDVSSVEFSTVFAHTEFDEDQTFTLTYTYDGRNLAEIRDMSFDFETAAVRFDFDRAKDFDYDAHEEMHFHVEADGLGIGCDFTLRLSYVAEGQISEYVVTPIGGYPFNPVGEDTYESTCKGINSAYSLCMLTFTTTTGTLFLDCINGGENSCDYGIVSKLDMTLVNSVTSDSGASVKRNFAGSGDSCTETLVYDVNDMEEHFIYIKYRKDGSVHRGTDCLRFTVRFE